ncbi:hypothetical protein [Pseudarthrobacter sp. MDT3-1]
MDDKEFVPDSVTNKMLGNRLGESDVETPSCRTATPRATAQVDYLDEILANGEELVHRLLGRAKETRRSDDNEAVIRHRLDHEHAGQVRVATELGVNRIGQQLDHRIQPHPSS